jgi:protein-S-isoprenylcysteine O-methyltransferase Ste14
MLSPGETAHGGAWSLWFVAQAILFCAMLLAPLLERRACPVVLRAVGLITLSGGVIVAVLGYRTLGRSHSPWTTPIADGQLVTTGMYQYMRHPIYAGWLLGALGWALLTSSRLGVGVALAGASFTISKHEKKKSGWRQPMLITPLTNARSSALSLGHTELDSGENVKT